MKDKRKFISIICILMLVTVIFIAGYTFARYYSKINAGVGYGSIARWSFGSKNEETMVSLSEKKIAPGTSGNFQIEVDATDSEVPVEYEVLVKDEKNIPHNMKFYAETFDEKGGVIAKTQNYNSFTELATENLSGKINVEKNNQKRNIIVYWDWEFNENDTGSVDRDDATLIIDENGNSSLDCGFNIEIIGKQSKVN